MNSPLYLRRKSSTQQRFDTPERHDEKRGSEDTAENLHVTGLRERKLVALVVWLAVISLLSVLLFVLNITLINVLQMTHHGMRSLKVHHYVDDRTGEEERVVHFAAANINLGRVLVKSGELVGSRDGKLLMQGSRIIAETESNDTRFLLQDGVCRFENVEQFQAISPVLGKTLFSAQRPLVRIDRKIKQLAASYIITNKIRSPVNEDLKLETKNVNLRGSEGIRIDTKSLNASAKTTILLKTSADGSLRLSGRRTYLGDQWKPLQLSTSPALSASVDAYRVCICTSGTRQKLFVVEGNKKCHAPASICP